MSSINHFSELKCWQNARLLTASIYREDSPNYVKDYHTKDQFRRAGLSVMNNLAEGFSRFSVKERIRFFEIAQSSASEVESMLYLFEDIEYIPTDKIDWYRQQTLLSKRQTLAFIKYLNKLK